MVDIEKVKQAANEIEARQRDIAKLENSIKELHHMFVDLALLVTTQVCILFIFEYSFNYFCLKGEMIDNIENNVLKTKDFVGHAAEEVYKAEQFHEGCVKVK
jgi:t-SNARE complex subunit (syntaxin)